MYNYYLYNENFEKMRFLRLLAFPFSLLYGLGMRLRNKAFDLKIIRSHEFDLPVIGVGNLTMGGTGKTPHIEYLVRLLKDEFKVATLSRGYKRLSTGFFEAEENSRVFDIGDEPLQFKKKFEDVVVAVDEYRKHGINKIMKLHSDINTVLLDDAFQHRQVKPGINILLTNYSKLYIHDHLLPTGNLREPRIGSHRADIIIVTKTPNVLSPLDIRRIKSQLRPKSYQRIYFSYQGYDLPVPVSKACKKVDFKNTNTNYSVLLVTGIAYPDPLKSHLIRYFKEVEDMNFPDHHLYDQNDLEDIKTRFDNIFSPNKIILTTEKDTMRLLLPDLQEYVDKLPIYYIPTYVEFHGQDKEDFDVQIKKYVSANSRISSISKGKSKQQA